MDNKDMNTMMKTVSPTGPGGIMKLKKIIKELLGKQDMPIASGTQIGGIKVGENLSINEEGVLSASSGSVGPLIVEGTIDGTAFTPNTGQPTYEDAVLSYQRGGNVILRFDYDDSVQYESVIKLVDDSDLVTVGNTTWSE